MKPLFVIPNLEKYISQQYFSKSSQNWYMQKVQSWEDKRWCQVVITTATITLFPKFYRLEKNKPIATLYLGEWANFIFHFFESKDHGVTPQKNCIIRLWDDTGSYIDSESQSSESSHDSLISTQHDHQRSSKRRRTDSRIFSEEFSSRKESGIDQWRIRKKTSDLISVEDEEKDTWPQISGGRGRRHLFIA